MHRGGGEETRCANIARCRQEMDRSRLNQISDCGNAYDQLDHEGFCHLKVNHNLHFKGLRQWPTPIQLKDLVFTPGEVFPSINSGISVIHLTLCIFMVKEGQAK